MSDDLSSDEYTEDTRAFHRRSSRGHGLEESESDSERPAKDPVTKVSLVMVE